MADAINITVTGASGPPGPASGPLGANSVEAVHITNDPTKLTALKSTLGISSTGTFGSTAAQGIDTWLNGSPVPADIGPVYMGVTASSADGVTIDSGSNFPPGVALRKTNGTLAAPTPVTVGVQIGYIDFRGYNSDGLGGGYFYNSGSIDCVIDGNIGFAPGQTPPSFLRFASCGDVTVGAEIGMEMRPYGAQHYTLWINHLYGEDANLPSGGAKPVLHLAQREPDWSFNIEAKNAVNNYGQRIYLDTEADADQFVFFASGAVKTQKFAIRGSGKVKVGAGAPACALDVDGAVGVGSYTVGTVPSAALRVGQIVYVSNEAGGATIAFSDGTDWRRVSDRAIIA